MKNGWENCHNILCVRPDSMGDVLMTTPAFRALKESNTSVRLTLLTSQSGEAIAHFIPEIDEIITANFPWEKSSDKIIESDDFLRLVKSVRHKKFDGAIMFTVFSQDSLLSALFCFLAGIPKRLAYSHQKPYHLLTDWVRDKEPAEGIRHEVERQLALVTEIGAMTEHTQLSLRIPKDAKRKVSKILLSLGIDFTKPLLIVHPGAASAKRRYSPLGFSEIIRKLSDAGYQVVCTGNKKEEVLVNLIVKQSQSNAKSLAGKLSLAEFIALINYSSLLISNNTGSVHIAAAFGTPVLDLYALTNPQHTPWKVPSTVLYYPVSETFQEDIVSSEIPKDAIPLENPAQAVGRALQLLKKTANHFAKHYENSIDSYTNI